MAFSKQQKIKCVAVGDPCTGKTCLLQTYERRTFLEEYIQTIFDNSETTVDVDGVSVTLSLYDTAGHEAYDRLRPLSYPQTDVVLIVFSLDCPTSFKKVSDKWYPEVSHYMPNAPLVLVGTKADLMGEPDQLRRMQTRWRDVPATGEQAEEMRKKIGASAYVECSAKTKEGVEDVFNEAVRTVWKSKKSKTCQIA